MTPTTNNSGSMISQLFGAVGITRVVYVDDRFGITPDRILALANELTIEELRRSTAFDGLDFNVDNEDILRGRISNSITVMTSEQLTDALDRLAFVHFQYEAGAKDQEAARSFHNALGGAADIIPLSLLQWEARKTELLAQAQTIPTLFIFDDDFSLEGRGKEHGRQLIGQTHGSNPNYRFVYALLTHNAPNEAAEVELQRAIERDTPELADYLLVIAKSRLTNGSEPFARRMKHLLLHRLFRVLTQRLAQETEEASRLARKQLEDLTIESFERIICGSSRIEGAWSPDTLARVVSVFQEHLTKYNLRSDPNLHQLVRDIEPISDVGSEVMSATVTVDALRLQREEIYQSGERVNSVHLPLASGDIFQDDKGHQYVLLAQPCDLVVRENGFRRAKDRDSRQIVPIAAVRKVESKYDGHNIPAEQYELPHFDPSGKRRWSVRLNETYFLPVWILDLAVFNKDGSCTITSGHVSTPLVVDPWKKRLSTVLERAGSVRSIAHSLNGGGEADTDVLQNCCRMPLATPFGVTLAPAGPEHPDEWKLAIKLRRTQRVTQQYSTALLIEYAAYLARLAYPHDLTRLTKH